MALEFTQGRIVRLETLVLVVCAAFALHSDHVLAQEGTQITVQTAKTRQEFEGLGAGAIFYEGHITSLASRSKNERQEQLYDDMFAKVPTRYLQLMIRETHEPQNDNNDPYTPAFEDKNFEYCKHTIQIAKAALTGIAALLADTLARRVVVVAFTGRPLVLVMFKSIGPSQ